jgi:cytochrome c oxidase assembly protein subunit 15
MVEQRLRVVRGWLLTLWLLVLVMVMVGGITRLTGSGLSIVEWRPVTGALPPVTETDWQAAFDAYRSSPQFVHQNAWMQLADFKQIYFWEYVHRLLGRFIGLATVLPWLYFVLRGFVSRPVALRTLSVLILGGLQGVLGWWMVKSGLVNEPRVSHYRLAAHLVLAFSVGQWILWQALSLLPAAPASGAWRLSASQRAFALGLLLLVALQVVYGAFMAGTRAGFVAATFPDMNGYYAPSHFFSTSALGRSLLDNPLSIHYVHRALALVLLIYVSVLAWLLRGAPAAQRATAIFLWLATLGQGALGALTVVLRVPLPVAVVHQGGAYVLCSAAILFLHSLQLGSRARVVPDVDASVAPEVVVVSGKAL